LRGTCDGFHEDLYVGINGDLALGHQTEFVGVILGRVEHTKVVTLNVQVGKRAVRNARILRVEAAAESEARVGSEWRFAPWAEVVLIAAVARVVVRVTATAASRGAAAGRALVVGFHACEYLVAVPSEVAAGA
jgi:hypothetical protein